MRKQDIVQQNETDGEELQQRAQQCLAEQLVHDLVREDSRAGAVELRAALTLQSAWRGRRGRALAEAQAVEMLQQNQQELTTLLAELELQQRRSQLVELQQLESQLKQLEKQKQLKQELETTKHKVDAKLEEYRSGYNEQYTQTER